MYSDTVEKAALIGTLMSGYEAGAVAERLSVGETLAQSLFVVDRDAREAVREALEAIPDLDTSLLILRTVAAAKSNSDTVMPVWSAPGHLAKAGGLNVARDSFVAAAKKSVVCCTYNFASNSTLWDALRDASERPGVNVKLYLDTAVNDEGVAKGRQQRTDWIAKQLGNVVVMRTRRLPDGTLPRNHAKFVSIDHSSIIVTSANFSQSAEEANVELGLRVNDADLVRMIENQMRDFEDYLYERVRPN